jgi:hypothetical protein
VWAGIKLARYRELTWESSIATYVCLMFSVHPFFERHPEIRKVFNDSSIEPNLRVRLMQNRISETHWSEAACQAPGVDDAWRHLCAHFAETAK